MSSTGRLVAQITVKIWENGSLSIEGPVEDTAWCLAALDHAKDAIRRKASQRVLPQSDVDAVVLSALDKA